MCKKKKKERMNEMEKREDGVSEWVSEERERERERETEDSPISRAFACGESAGGR